jgi:hypothetical protein
VSDSVDSFRVIARDDYGKPARCSYCPRAVERVVVLPLADRSELVDDRWLGVCAYCVLEMARALARSQGRL